MSQVDKVIFLPLLSWFILVFLKFYFYSYHNLVNYILFIFKTRILFFNNLIINGFHLFSFIALYYVFCSQLWIKAYLNIINLNSISNINITYAIYYLVKI